MCSHFCVSISKYRGRWSAKVTATAVTCNNGSGFELMSPPLMVDTRLLKLAWDSRRGFEEIVGDLDVIKTLLPLLKAVCRLHVLEITIHDSCNCLRYAASGY